MSSAVRFSSIVPYAVYLLVIVGVVNLYVGFHMTSTTAPSLDFLQKQNSELRIAVIKAQNELESSREAIHRASQPISVARQVLDSIKPAVEELRRDSQKNTIAKISSDSRTVTEPSSATSISKTASSVESTGSVDMSSKLIEKLHEIHLPSATERYDRTVLFDDATAVIMFCYGRPQYLSQTIESVIKSLQQQLEVDKSRGTTLSSTNKMNGLFFVFSQDGNNEEVSRVLENAVERLENEFELPAFHVRHPRANKGNKGPYYKLADHFRWGLNLAFKRHSEDAFSNPDPGTMSKLDSVFDAKQVIVLEDDMLLAPDFFEYMGSTKVLLNTDDDLLAVSAWNDHGQRQFVHDREVLLRSDFFPGLGWMLTSTLWDELEPKWPEAYWDDWLRDENQRKGRQVIHPEVSRTYTIGESGGASSGQYYREWLAPMQLNDKFVRFTEKDLSYLRSDRFQSMFRAEVDQAVPMTLSQANLQPRSRSHLLRGSIPTEPFVPGPGTQPSWKFGYTDFKEYAKLCKELGIMDDVRGNVPRGAYMGIVRVWIDNRKVYLVPQSLL